MEHFAFNTDYGNRDRRNERLRWLSLAVIAALVVAAEVVFGRALNEQEHARFAGGQPLTHASRRYEDLSGRMTPLPKTTKRLLYVSNSHAFTGGRVSIHLQNLLTAVAPGAIEVLDSSSYGIFAPEVLERVASAVDYAPDIAVIALMYPTSNDQMKLRDQSDTALRFFRRDVRPRLPLGFWLRHYDVNLFASEALGQVMNLVRFRAQTREIVAGWMARALAALDSDPQPSLFLESHAKRTWMRPNRFGIKNNNLASVNVNQESNLKDIADTLSLLRAHGIYSSVIMLPIDPAQLYPHGAPYNFANFAAEFASVSASADMFTSLQDRFPVGAFTYDGLHPTVHGARLHALDLLLRLREQKLVPQVSDPEIRAAYEKGVESERREYEEALASIPKQFDGFRRASPRNIYAIGVSVFESDGVEEIFRTLASHPYDSPSAVLLDGEIRRRLGSWQNASVLCDPTLHPAAAALWCEMTALEERQYRDKLELFARLYSEIRQRYAKS